MANCLLRVPNYGQYPVSVSRIQHGITIIPSGSAKTRRTNYLYILQVSSSGFSMTVQFTSYSDRQHFASWYLGFAKQLTDPDAVLPTPMWIDIPEIDFHKTGVPVSGVVFGDKVGQQVWNYEMRFRGATDPLEDPSSPLLARYEEAEKSRSAKFFYPSGVQLAGDQKDSYYGSPLDDLPDDRGNLTYVEILQLLRE